MISQREKIQRQSFSNFLLVMLFPPLVLPLELSDSIRAVAQRRTLATVRHSKGYHYGYPTA